MESGIYRIKPKIVLCGVLIGSLILSSCAPVYRFIKGKDPEHVLGTPVISTQYKDYFSGVETNLINATLNQMVIGPFGRLPGTVGETNTAEYLNRLLIANGYSVKTDIYPVEQFIKGKLNIKEPDADTAIESIIIEGTGKEPKTGTFRVLDLGGGMEDDLFNYDLKDKLILVEKKFRNLDDICKDVEELDGAGVIYFSNVEKYLPQDEVHKEYDFPVFSIPYEKAKNIIGRIEDKEKISLIVSDNGEDFKSKSRSVTGILGEFDSSKKTIYLTTNIDSALNSPGANDNASGTAALIQIAEFLSRNKSGKFNIMISFFGGSTLDNIGEKEFLEKANPKLLESIILRIGIGPSGHGENINYKKAGDENEGARIKALTDMSKNLGYTLNSSVNKTNFVEIFGKKGVKSSEISFGFNKDQGTLVDSKESVNQNRVKDMVNIVINLINEMGK